jgi:phage gpG-like protein
MLPITVRSDIGAARAVLERAKELGLHPGPLLEIAGGILEESTRDRFRTSSGPGGIPWPPSGRQRFAARPGGKGQGRSIVGPNRGGRTLVDSGGLESSVTHVADDKRVEVGIIAKTQSAKFAYVHQFGATIRPKRGPFLVFTAPDGHKVFARQVVIPARPIIGIDEQDRTDLLEAWTAYIESELGK